MHRSLLLSATAVCLLSTAACATIPPEAPAPSPAEASPAEMSRGPIYRDVAPMNRTVETRITPRVEALLEQLRADGRDYRLDGVAVFEAHDKFLPGKIAVAMAHVLSQTPRTDPNFPEYLSSFRRLADLTVDDPNDSWGIYYYASALHELQVAGLLDQAVSPETLAKLRTRLDWRRFVRTSDLTLINLPNNYFGVAFSIARLRYLLGWEDASASEALLAKTLDHFREYSGQYGFADETNGDGRFDRYSVLLIGEIAQRFIETGVPPPPEVKTWLRSSVDLMLPRLNLRGEGFEYGRSIGTYGETAFLEVLTAAASLDVLTDQEKAMAYAFSSRVAARYADFWLDPATGSVNLWDHGRKTDAYRGKHRILGENLSLAHQLLYTNAIWNRLGYHDAEPDTGFEAWLGTLPRSQTNWFAKGEYDRLLVTWRDGSRVIGLPLINGGDGQHMNTPYFPIPFSPGVLAGAADETYPQLLPRLTLSDGSVLQPLAYFTHAEVTTEGDRTIVTYSQSKLDRMGQPAPVADDRVSVSTRYVLEPGRITRTDHIEPRDGVTIAKIDMTFASFGEATVAAHGARYGDGEIAGFEVTGLNCEAGTLDPKVHRTPVGALRSVVECGTTSPAGPVDLSWSLSFRDPPTGR
jgi:hypothetical protein